MNIALVSLEQIWENKDKNLELCERYIQAAAQKNVELIIFPEMTLTAYSMDINLIGENENNSLTIESFKELSKKYNIAVIFGVVIFSNMKAENRVYFLNQNSNLFEHYTKIHPFSFADENKFFIAGNKIKVVKYKEYTIGLTICYDLRFPELFSVLANESDLIINIANWPAKRIDHWNTLLKARAIENQIFIAGINRTGIDGNGLEYIESTNIFNANGEILNSMQIENMKIYNINKNWTKDFKNSFNTINDKKNNFYKEVL